MVSLFFYTVCDDGDLRISGVSSLLEGSIEICINNSYGSVCDDFWDIQDARVACRQLGFSNGTCVCVCVCAHIKNRCIFLTSRFSTHTGTPCISWAYFIG